MKTIRIIQIAVWSAVAALLTGLLIFFLARGGYGGYSGWRGWFPAAAYGAGAKTVDKTVTDDVSAVDVKVADADVIYRTGGDGIRVVCYGGDNGGGYTVEEGGGTLHVEQNWQPFSWHWFSWGGRRVEITLPAGYRGSVSSVSASGDVALPASLTLSAFTAATASGGVGGEGSPEITARNVGISTASGDIRLGGVDGKTFAIRSVSGDVTLGSLAGQGSLDSTSGDLHVGALTRMDGGVNAATVSGDIRFGIRDGVAANISAHSLSGGISSSRALSFSGSHSAAGQTGAGGEPLQLSSTSGDIRVG